MSKELRVIEPVTVALRRESIDLVAVRVLFDKILKKILNLDVKRNYLYKNATILTKNPLGNGVAKILDGKELELEITERITELFQQTNKQTSEITHCP